MSTTISLSVFNEVFTRLRQLFDYCKKVGPVLVPELQWLSWPPGIEIDDLGPGGPIAAVHRFREAPPYAWTCAAGRW